MSGKALKPQANIRIGIAAIGLLALAACDENGQFQMPAFGETPAASDGAAPLTPSPAASLVERDVEAPEVFEITENGLWDGRPSLGGVWVAHPNVVDPERVIIRNQTNGKFVIGALFRRERDNPGPALQVSSDAAEELGILAGAPTLINVVALRREEGPAEIPVADAFAAPDPVAALPLDAAPAPEATIERSPEPTPVATDTLTGAAAIAIAAAEAASASAPAAAAAPAPTPAAAPAPRQTATLNKPFVQIGIFSIESNATRTAELLRGNGLSATIRAQESQGRPFWRVIVGPAPNAEDRAAVLSKVKSLGFTDAYAVTN